MRACARPLVLLSCVVNALAGSAYAAGFDADTGTVVIEDAAYRAGFDEIDPAVALSAVDINGNDVLAVDELLTRANDALEGDGYLTLGGSVAQAQVDLQGLPELVGRRVEIKVWQRSRGTQLAMNIYWYAGDYLTAVETGTEGVAAYLGTLPLVPTGNATSDGWREMTSGPVDAAAAGVVGPSLLSVYDEQYLGYYAGFSYDFEARVDLDALHVVDLGPAVVPDARCTLRTERDVCGDEGVCKLGRCTDGAPVVGPAIRDPDIRAQTLERRLAEFTLFEGGRAPQEKLGAVRAAMAPALAGAGSGTFWPSVQAAIELLEDGHASAPFLAYPASVNAAVCLHEGSADLLPAGTVGDDNVTPLVFFRSDNPDNPIAELLQEGDALTSIDGLAPAAWAVGASRSLSYPGDPVGRSVVTAPQLLPAAIDAGSVVTFSRCDSDVPCTADTTTVVTLDFGALLGDAIYGGTFPTWRNDYRDCDFRFRRAVEEGNVTDYSHAAFGDVGGARVLQINGVPSPYDEEGEAWFQTVEDALADGPATFVLDQRQGGGGSIEAVDLLMGMLLESDDFARMDMLPNLEGDTDADDVGVFRDCAAFDQSGLGCGSYIPWELGAVAGAAQGAAGQSRVAVLIANDVSGNDYTTKLATFRSADTRFVGAGSTWGAFGVIWSLPNHFGELAGGSHQVHDTLFHEGQSLDPLPPFTTSTGVRPDLVVRQTQSDARRGVDTVLQAAVAWVLE